jgi:hypothetical protein
LSLLPSGDARKFFEEEFRSQNSGVRIKTLVRPWRLPLGEDSLTLRYQSGIQTGAGIVAPPNLDLEGVLNPFIHPPVAQNSF